MPAVKLAPGWSADLSRCPRNQSVLLACTYADQPDAWFRGEAVCERGGDQWFWIGGRRVAPEFVPRAWMAIPFVLADDDAPSPEDKERWDHANGRGVNT